MFRKCIFLAITSLFVLILSCKKEKIVTEYVTQNIFLCWLHQAGDQEGEQAVLVSDPIADPAQSEVKMKWNGNTHVFFYERINPGYIWFEDTIALVPLKIYTVELNSNIGNCSGKVPIPGTLNITTPQEGDTLPLGQNVNCQWTSDSATFYEVRYYANAYDNSGNSIGSTEEVDTFLTQTQITIPGSYFNIPGAAYYVMSIGVGPYSGPLPQPGSKGNMAGEKVKGFLTGFGSIGGVYFYVGTPVVKHKIERKERTLKERMQAYLNAIGTNIELK